jgi:hypothetical protein
MQSNRIPHSMQLNAHFSAICITSYNMSTYHHATHVTEVTSVSKLLAYIHLFLQ